MRPLPYPQNLHARLARRSPHPGAARPQPAALVPQAVPAALRPQAPGPPPTYRGPTGPFPIPPGTPQNLVINPGCVRTEEYGTEDLWVTGPADIFALGYEPARRGSQFEYDPDPADLANPFAGIAGNEISGGSLVATNPTKDITWWNVTIFGTELFGTVGGTAPTKEEILANGAPVSMLKARIRWTEYPGRFREIMVDIGSGVDLFVGPTVRVEIDIMVPIPATAPVGTAGGATAQRPLIFGPDGENVRFFTYVVGSATCVQSPVGRKAACYTQNVYLTTVDAQLRVDIPIPADARVVQGLSGFPTGNNPLIFGMFPPVRTTVIAPANPLVILGATDYTGTSTARVDVPQTAKAVINTIDDAQPARVQSIKFELQR